MQKYGCSKLSLWEEVGSAPRMEHEINVYKVEDVDAEIAEQKQLTAKWHERACEHAKEADTAREVLTLLAPDLKTMAILYQQQGDHTRAQALMNICKSVGLS